MDDRVLILADNQPLTRAGFARLFGDWSVRTVADKKALAHTLGTVRCAVVVLDYA